MKKFLYKFGLFILPVLVLFFLTELGIRNISNDYAFKNNYLENNSKDVEVLILGSSHSYYGLNPIKMKGNVFNASYVSQSLEYDYKIYEKFSPNLKKLKILIIPIDYSTLFAKLSESQEYWRVKNYSIYYGFHENYSLSDNYEIFNLNVKVNFNRVYNYYVNKTSSITCNEKGFGNDIKESKNLEKSGPKAAKRHTKSNKEFLKENLEYLKKIAHLAKQNDVKIIFYSSPCYHTYYENIEPKQYQIMKNSIEKFCEINSHCFYNNLLESKLFEAKDFRDADHLNNLGANKLSMYMDSVVSSI